jgi:Dolichyl-phosphate-mannose-protein mannosyltransferase
MTGQQDPIAASRGGEPRPPGPRPARVAWLVLLGLALAAPGLAALPLLRGFALTVLVRGAGLALLMAGWIGWGRLAVRVVRRAAETSSGDAAARDPWWLELGVGAALTGLLWGACAAWRMPGVAATSVWSLAGVGALAWRRVPSPRPAADPPAPTAGRGLLAAVAALFGLPPLLHALAPATALDSVVYHLAVPRQYLLAGRAYEMPWNLHSYFPRHAAMLFAQTLAFDDSGSLAQLLSLALAVSSLAALARLGRRLFGDDSGVWAALLLLTMPALNVVAGWAYADWAMLFFAIVAIERVYRHFEHGRPSDLYLGGLLLGAAVACKDTALPLLVLPLALVSRVGWRRAAVVALLATAAPAPWWLLDLWWQGNPIFPLAGGGSVAAGVSALVDYRGDAGLASRLAGYLGRADLLDESLGLLWPLALPLLLTRRPSRLPLAPMVALIAAYVPIGLVYHPTVRAFAVPLALLAVLAAGRLGGLAGWLRGSDERRRRWVRRAATAAASAALACNLWIVLWTLDDYRPIAAALAVQPPAEYLAQARRYAVPFAALEANAAATDGVLVVGESRIFNLRRPAIAGTYLDPHPIAFFGARECGAACAADRLWEWGVRWLYFDESGYRVGELAGARLTDESVFRVRADDDAAWRDLLASRAQPAFRRGPVSVFRLLPPPAQN